MAFICAIGMSFTTANSTILQSTGFVEIAEDDWLEVQVDCGTGDLECQVKFSENGEPYNVYESDQTTRRRGGADEPIMISLP